MLSPEMISALIGSFSVSFLVVVTKRWHGRLTLDHDLQGIQKIHRTPVPRIGGLGVAIGLIFATFIAFYLGGRKSGMTATLLFCAVPVFLAGLSEDITKKVSVRMRLNASFTSAALAVWMLDAELIRLNTPFLDTLVTFAPISVLFTCFAVGGVTHAINIIDGLNGLAAGSVSLMLAGFAAIAWQAGDVQVMNMCLWGIAALLGFLCLNYPFGRIFLGDGGAYLAGFWLAECGVLLLSRNPEVSTWAVLLCCLYPVWETLFSVYRRQIIHRVSSGTPDMTHMHHLVYRRLLGNARNTAQSAWRTHGLTSATIWLAVAACPLVAALAYQQTALLMCATLAFVVAYNAAYKLLQPNEQPETCMTGLPLQSDP
jgi:UDP-N-acetylmuramyl pentapeptide phosphotransferase/UDP-N-acetylglucosamine-1-phosphate transferase